MQKAKKRNKKGREQLDLSQKINMFENIAIGLEIGGFDDLMI
jgi:hypothetical protein